MAIDVVGYSRLMGEDEVGTLAALKQQRASLIEPVVKEHHGRIVKLMGDGILVEFASAVNAVVCAVALQQRNGPESSGARGIVFRIGVNLGDIVVEGEDIYGDGVNIAARLEEIAEPGGIAISRKVRDEIDGKYELICDDLGERVLKNIKRLVHVYRVVDLQRQSVGADVAPLALPVKPSIAVLPFTSMNADASEDYFADGLSEDLITELSKSPNLFVIARHSTFAFKGKSMDVRRIAQDLGVRYILEGSARRSSQRVRINAQLIDATGGGAHIWAERFDRNLSDVFQVQDEVVASIVEALVGRLAMQKLPDRNIPASLDAYDLCIRGRFLYHSMLTREGQEARNLFQQAVTLDPGYAEAHAYLAMTHWLGWVNWQEPADPHRRLALEHAQRAVALDAKDPFAHLVWGFVLEYEREYETADEQLKTALSLDPNHADTYAMRADLLVMDGRPLEAIDSTTRAFRLNPRPPAWYYWMKGEAEYAARQYAKVVTTLRHESTYSTPSRSILAAALAQLGRLEEARLEGRLFMADSPDFRITEFLATQPFRHEPDRQHFAEGYRLAGLADQ